MNWLKHINQCFTIIFPQINQQYVFFLIYVKIKNNSTYDKTKQYDVTKVYGLL